MLAETKRSGITGCEDGETEDGVEYYRLRSFSITANGVFNLGDSLKSRRSRSINSVTSSGTSCSSTRDARLLRYVMMRILKKNHMFLYFSWALFLSISVYWAYTRIHYFYLNTYRKFIRLNPTRVYFYSPMYVLRTWNKNINTNENYWSELKSLVREQNYAQARK